MATERQRKGYTAEFKRNAVKLVLDGRHTCSSVERSLGVGPGIVYRWVRPPQESFPGNGRLKSTDERIRVLERALQTARMERDISNKALAVFSRGPAKPTASWTSTACNGVLKICAVCWRCRAAASMNHAGDR